MRADEAVWFIISGGCWVSLERCSREMMTSCCVSVLYKWSHFIFLTFFSWSRQTGQQLKAWPIRMKQSCRDVFRIDNKKSTKCSKCLKPKFSSCRRFVDLVTSTALKVLHQNVTTTSSSSSTGFQEAQLARSEAERMATLAGSQSNASLLSLDTPMEDVPEDERPPRILSPPDTTKDRWAKHEGKK